MLDYLSTFFTESNQSFLCGVAALVLSALVLFRDFKSREISIPVAILLALSLLVWTKQWYLGYMDIAQNWMQIHLFLFIQFTLLFVYIQIRHKDGKNLFRRWMGLGDVLFLSSVSFAFGLFDFVFFFILSTLLAILFYIFSMGKMKKIPYAGIAAILIFCKTGYELLMHKHWTILSFSL